MQEESVSKELISTLAVLGTEPYTLNELNSLLPRFKRKTLDTYLNYLRKNGWVRIIAIRKEGNHAINVYQTVDHVKIQEIRDFSNIRSKKYTPAPGSKAACLTALGVKQKERKPKSQRREMRGLLPDLLDAIQEWKKDSFTAKELAPTLDREYGRTSVSTYLGLLRETGYLEYVVDSIFTRERRYRCLDKGALNNIQNYAELRAIAATGRVAGAIKEAKAEAVEPREEEKEPTLTLEPPHMGEATMDNTTPVSLLAFKEAINDLDWFFQEYVPGLEKENTELKGELRDMKRFLDNFAGKLRQAKEIRLRVAEQVES